MWIKLQEFEMAVYATYFKSDIINFWKLVIDKTIYWM